MEIQGIGVVTLLFGLTAFGYPNAAFAAFVASTLLGSAAALFIGAANIQPAHVMLGFLALGMLTNRRALQNFELPKAAFWLIGAAFYGIAGAYFLPRFFAGQTLVTAIGVTEFGYVPIPVPLGPTSGNVTQSIYFAGGVLCFLISYLFAKQRGNLRYACLSLLAVCLLNIAFAFLDLATYSTGTAFLLDPIRNSNYALLVSDEIEGIKRIAGSFSEASAFGSVSVANFGFLLRLSLGGVLPAITLPAALVTFVLVIMSTSSAAYLTLPFITAVLLINSAFRVTRRRGNIMSVLFVIMTPLVAFFGIMAILMSPELSKTLYNFIDVTILSKSQSASGIERTQWNVIALQNFVDTYGLGVGIGGVRASSWAVAVLANMGLVGGGAYFVFVYLVLAARTSEPESFSGTFQGAAQIGCIGILAGGMLAGTMVDLGLYFFVMAGVAAAASQMAAVEPVLRRQTDRLFGRQRAPTHSAFSSNSRS